MLRSRLWLFSCALGLLASATALAQTGEQAAVRSEAQSRFVARRLAMPPPTVYVVGNREPAAGTGVPARGILYGSFGISAAWSVGFLQYANSMVIRRKNVDSPLRVTWGTMGGTPWGSTLQAELPVPGEKVGEMLYSVFKVELEAGDYEVAALYLRKPQVSALPTGREVALADFTAVPFRIEAGRPVYLGRITVIPRMQESEVADSRSQIEQTMNPVMPVSVVGGLAAWVQDAPEADATLAGVPPHPKPYSLANAFLALNPAVCRATVTRAEIDHEGRAVR